MAGLLINIDVPDLAAGEAFYTRAFGLTVGRRFDGFLELLGAPAPIYLLANDPGSATAGTVRDYGRHWTPIHFDHLVDDLDAATARVLAAGAVAEGPIADRPYGRIALFADPFGHGFCMIQFNAEGYDAIAD